jgi:hypothetical protein
MVSVVAYKFDALALAARKRGETSSYNEDQDVSLIFKIATPYEPVAQRRPISARITTIRSTRPSPLLG